MNYGQDKNTLYINNEATLNVCNMCEVIDWETAVYSNIPNVTIYMPFTQHVIGAGEVAWQ